MNGLIKFSLNNWYAVVVMVLTIAVLGAMAILSIPVDILPVNRSPAVQVFTFYSGMPAALVERNISNRLERWTGQGAGTARQESRSLNGVSIVRNYYREGTDGNGALTQVVSLASVATPYLPPGTLPPIILPYDPTATTPICLIALDSKTIDEAKLADTGRFEVRNMIMAVPGAVAPVVYGGKQRVVLAYMNREQMQARDLSPDRLRLAMDDYNVFLPPGNIRLGNIDYALDSNAMYFRVEQMKDIPIKTEGDRTVFLQDVAKVEDTNLPQTNVVRVAGQRQVYIPVYRQSGSSTLDVVRDLNRDLPDIQSRLTFPDIELKLVMDQSIYVRHSIVGLVTEGLIGAVLCSLVILVFLGEWRMTFIAILTIPIAVFASIVGLNYTDNTINVMTLAGLALAIGPLVDSAIICLENTHRHLGLGVHPKEAAYYGASEVAMPELVASCCTLMVLAPLAIMPSSGRFLFRPMALAVTFAMVAAYLLSRSFVPAMCALWLRGHGPAAKHGTDYEHKSVHEIPPDRSWLGRLFERWENVLNACIGQYTEYLDQVLSQRGAVLGGTALVALLIVVGGGRNLRREFFPEVDAGAFEIYVRAMTGLRIEETEKRIKDVEKHIARMLGEDLQLVISEIGVNADWSAAYTPNAGPMDAVVKVQLQPHRTKSAQDYVAELRESFQTTPINKAWADLEFAFDAGGMIRSAMNEGKSSPINIQITAKDLAKTHAIAEEIRDEVSLIPGVVDCRVIQRLDYPQYYIEVDQTKAAALGLNQVDVMKNVIAALNSSIQFHKKNYWIDPVSNNTYYVGVSYKEETIESLDTMRALLITSPTQKRSIPLGNIADIRPSNVASEVTHSNLQTTIDITMGVQDRDLGSVADEVALVLNQFGKRDRSGEWRAFDPSAKGLERRAYLAGSKIRLSGEYARMQDTFRNLGLGLVLATLLIYFLMVALFKSWVTPLVILAAVPVGLVGVVLILLVTHTALNVQSLLGVIFMVGIVVSNTVLMVDFAQHLRREEKLSPLEAIRKAARIRVRPVIMTALATFFALLPMALGLERGSEANTPLGRSVIGGLLAGLVTTLFVVPCLYTLLVRDSKRPALPATPNLPI